MSIEPLWWLFLSEIGVGEHVDKGGYKRGAYYLLAFCPNCQYPKRPFFKMAVVVSLKEYVRSQYHIIEVAI